MAELFANKSRSATGFCLIEFVAVTRPRRASGEEDALTAQRVVEQVCQSPAASR